MKYLVFYGVRVDCTFSISYEKFHSYAFTKNIEMRFFIQTRMIKLKKKIVEKLLSFEI